MKKQLMYFGLVVFILTLGMTNVQSTAPLEGTIDVQFNLGWPGPQTEIPDWIGFITINGVQYGIAFFNIGSGKSFTDGSKGKNSFFSDLWFIYDTLDFQFADPGVLVSFTPGSILLAGNDHGVLNLETSQYNINGAVQEAHGIFESWLGHTVHESGVIQWYPFGAPQYAIGDFRIN